RRHVQKQDGIKVEHLKHHDAPKAPLPQPIDWMIRRDQSQFRQAQIDRAEPRQQLLQTNRADKWRHDHRQQQQTAKQRFSSKGESSQYVRERQREQRRERGRQQSDEKTIGERLALQRTGKQPLKIFQAEPALDRKRAFQQ